MMRLFVLFLLLLMMPVVYVQAADTESKFTCTPAILNDPVFGCGDLEIDFNQETAKEFITTGNPMSFLKTFGCCSCDDVTKVTQGMFDGHRQNNWMAKLGGKKFTPQMDLGTASHTAHLILQPALSGNLLNAATQAEFLDAQNEAATNSITQSRASEGLCRMASLSQSIAANDQRRTVNQLLFSEIGLARANGKEGSLSARGTVDDTRERIAQFKGEYCRGSDFNNALSLFCGATLSIFSQNKKPFRRQNADINFAESFALRPSLNINFADPKLMMDEQSMIAMSYNFYRHEPVSPRFASGSITSIDYMRNFRMKLAMQSVAQNSFYAQVAERAAGSGKAVPSMNALVREMGAKPLPANPSYYQQMQFLTKDLYKNSNFYGTLMEGKTNVARQSAFMDAVDLMQTRDIYLSSLRSEMLLSSLVELQIRPRLETISETYGQ